MFPNEGNIQERWLIGLCWAITRKDRIKMAPCNKVMAIHLLVRTSPVGQNLTRWPEPHLLVRPSPVGENLTCWSEPHLLVRTSPVGQNLSCWSEPHLLVRTSPIGQNLTCWSEPHLLVRASRGKAVPLPVEAHGPHGPRVAMQAVEGPALQQVQHAEGRVWGAGEQHVSCEPDTCYNNNTRRNINKLNT